MKQIFYITLLALLPLFFGTFSRAQAPQMLDNLKTVVPPSPNSASLGQYAAWPISLNTGLANISIPVYSLKGRSISIPIGLNYHASGIHVGDVASWVGLGWSLDVGGVISRSVRGLPDDDPISGYLAIRQQYINPADLGSRTSPESIDSNYRVQAGIGLADGEPDSYTISALGKSYKLFFSGNGTIVTEPASQLKITCNWSDSTWKVILEDGTILNFGGGWALGKYLEYEEGSLSANPAYDIDQCITSWYLRSIVTTTGETVNFTYTSSTVSQFSYISQSDNMYNSNTGGVGNGQVTCACDNGTPVMASLVSVPGETTNSRLQQTVSLFPATISSDLGRIEFVLHPSQRLDLQGGYALDSVRVFSKMANRYIREFAFSYSYSNAVYSQGAYTDPNGYANNRLKLNELTELSMDNSPSKVWTFQYNPRTLPSRASFAQDYWGYFNGKTQNSSLLPEIYPTAALYSSFSQPTYPVGVRDPDSASMQAEILTAITYPTGGTTTFNYAPNSYIGEVEQTQSQGVNQQIRLDETHLTPFVTSYTQNFHVNFPQTITISGGATFSKSYVDDHGNGEILGDYYVQELYPPNGQPPFGAGHSYTGTGGSNVISISLKDTGMYKFTIEIPGASSDEFTSDLDYAKINANFFYSDTGGVAPAEILAGGVRIASQVISDGIDTSKNQYIEYVYSNPLVLNPLNLQTQYISTLREEVGNNACSANGTGCFQEYLVRHSASQESLGSVQGGNVGYSTVQTIYGRNGENGYSLSYFSNGPDEAGNLALLFPYPPVCVTDWRRGQLLRQDNYTSSGALVGSQVENYGYVVPLYIHGYKAGQNTLKDDGNPVPLPFISTVDESVKSEQVQHLSSTRIAYDQITGDTLSTTTTFYYDNPNDLNPVRSVMVDSKLDTVTTYSRTPLELSDINTSVPLTADATTALDTMLARNMVAIPIESEKYVAGVLQEKLMNNYRVQSSGLVLPDNIMQQFVNYPLETRYNFYQYDSYGNILDQAKTGDAHRSYIWDYQHQYPIAEVLNAQQSDIAYTGFEADGSGNWVVSGGYIDTTAAITGRSSLVNGTVSKSGLTPSTTYIVSYWSQNGPYGIAGTISGYPQTGKTIVYNNSSWTLYTHKVSGEATISLSPTGHIDELRLYPAVAQMTTYNYDPLIGMTSMTDAGSRTTYYEYDGLQRLKRVRDQDYNILKTIEYAYQTPAGCGGNCAPVAMQTFAGTNTISYPVGVFDIHGKLVGNATNAASYVASWNSDTADARVGTLSAGSDSMHFNLNLNAGQVAPSAVTGCRYYQYDLSYHVIDGIRNFNGAYVDFNDGTGMRLGVNNMDTPKIIAPNTTLAIGGYHDYYNQIFLSQLTFIHAYPNDSLKTLTFYHNDDTANSDLDNINSPATSLTHLSNLRGNLPQNTLWLGGSSYQQAGAMSVANITNWNTIKSVWRFNLQTGDGGQTVPNHPSYSQDFMQNNKGLQYITIADCIDTSFKISRLKSDWNTYFTQLFRLVINDNQWNRENLSALTNLWQLQFISNSTNGAGVIDSIINQIAMGAGHYRTNGVIQIVWPGYDRTSVSAAGYAYLKSRNWIISINGVNE